MRRTRSALLLLLAAFGTLGCSRDAPRGLGAAVAEHAPAPMGNAPPGTPTGSASSAGAPTPLRDALRAYGYAELQPPSTLLPPGTIVQVRDTLPFRASILCTARAAFGDSLGVEWSATNNRQLTEAVRGTFALSADYLATLHGKAGYGAVRNVTFTLSNAQVGELSRDQVFDRVRRRSQGCRTAVQEMYDHGENFTLVTSVLRASVLYTVQFSQEAHLDLAARQKLVKGVAAELGLAYAATNEATISGESIYWGIQDDGRLAYLRSNGRYYDLGTRGVAPADTSPIRVITPGARVAVVAGAGRGAP